MSTSKKSAKPSAAKSSASSPKAVPVSRPSAGGLEAAHRGGLEAVHGGGSKPGAAPEAKHGLGAVNGSRPAPAVKPGAEAGTAASSGAAAPKGHGNGKAKPPPVAAKGGAKLAAASPSAHAVGAGKSAAGGPSSGKSSKSSGKAPRPDSATRKKAAAQARAEVAWDKATAKAAEVDGGRRKLPKGGPSKADLRRYRDVLLAKRRELLSSSKELAAEALQAGGGEFSVDHMADHGSDNYEQDFNLKLLEGESQQLAEIRDALLKIDGKADLPFGLCEACSDEDQKLCESCPWIPATRLDALPWTRLCVQTKSREEERSK